MRNYIKTMKPGTTFSLLPNGTVYKAVLIRTGVAQTTVEYVVPGSEALGGFKFTKPSLTVYYPR